MWEAKTARHYGLKALEFIPREFYPSPNQMYSALMERGDHKEVIDFVGPRLHELVSWPVSRGGELTDIGILRHLIAGNIIINPFNINSLQSNGYDVSLGHWYYEFDSLTDQAEHSYPSIMINGNKVPLFNPADRQNVLDVYGAPKQASRMTSMLDDVDESAQKMLGMRNFRFLRNLSLEDSIIILGPHRMILGHTVEYIGGRNVVDTNISGKSSLGRVGVEACSDANKGDVGFTGIWTLEIRNKHNTAVVLPVGDKVATVTFFEVEKPVTGYNGRYAGQIEDWTPDRMLPNWKRGAK